MLPLTDAARAADRDRPGQWAIMRQRWEYLLFLHWAWDPAEIQRTLPPGLTADTFAGSGWLGLVPFFMRGVRPVYVPSVPGISNFLELNVRTYVRDEHGRAGVWFYSLDANLALAVRAARASFYLPYEHATMTALARPDGWVNYSALRRGSTQLSQFRYRPVGEYRESMLGSLDFFLVERYRLYAFDPRRRRLFTARVAHAPYRLHEAEVPQWDATMLGLAGFRLETAGAGPRRPDHVCAAETVNVEVFSPTRVTVA